MTKVRRLGSNLLLLIATIAWTACSNDLVREEALPDKGYTLTVEATKGKTTGTRGLNPPENNQIAAVWSENDRVTVLSANNTVLGTMVPTSIGDYKTHLKATLNNPVKKGDHLTLVFPRTGRDYTGQKGTLNDIATNYDYATSEVEVTFTDGSFVSATNAIFINQQAIVRFNLTDGKNPISASDLTISAEGLLQNATTTGPITITPADATSEIYAALSGLNGIVTLNATINNQTYHYVTSDTKSFNNGGFYRITAKMKPPINYPEPLTLENCGDEYCNVTVTDFGDLQYKKGDEDWTTYTSTTRIRLNSRGEKVSFRGTNATKGSGGSNYMNIICNGPCYVYGNVMSLLSKDGYAKMTELPYDHTFQNLFMGNTNITHAEGKDLVLPATKLTQNCYYQMFSGCTNMNYVKCLATDISAKNCTYNWLNNTARRGTRTFVMAIGADWPLGSDSGIPDGWTVIEE